MELNNVSLTQQQGDNLLLCQGMAENTTYRNFLVFNLDFHFTNRLDPDAISKQKENPTRS